MNFFFLQIEDEKLAGVVGLEVGVYEIKEMFVIQEFIIFSFRVVIVVNSVNSVVKRNLNIVIKDEIFFFVKKFKQIMIGLIFVFLFLSSLSFQNLFNSSIVVYSSFVITVNKKMIFFNNDFVLNNFGRFFNQIFIVIYLIFFFIMSKVVVKVKT